MSGSGDLDDEIAKCVNKEDEAPKRKHVRNAVILAWRNNGAVSFFNEVSKRVGKTGDVGHHISAMKAMTVVHTIMIEGPPRTMQEAQHQLPWLANVAAEFKRAHTTVLAPLIVEYIGFFHAKAAFHKTHPQFEGNLNLDEYIKTHGTTATSADKTSELIGHLMDLQDGVIKMEKAVFSIRTAKDLTELRVSCLIPLTIESYAIYTLVVYLMKRLVDQTSDHSLLSFLQQRFYTQYAELKNLYFECANVKYVASIISVPTLPRDPPQFVASKKKAPSSEPESLGAPSGLNPALFQQPAPWGDQAATVSNQWAFPPPVQEPDPAELARAELARQQALAEQQRQEMLRQQELQRQELLRQQQALELQRQQMEAQRQAELAHQEMLRQQELARQRAMAPPVDEFASLRNNARDKEFEDLKRRVAQLEADLARERAEKELMRREMEALRAELAKERAEKEVLRSQIEPLMKEISSERAEKELLRKELEGVKHENHSLKLNLNAMQEAYLRERKLLTENELDAACFAMDGHLRKLDDPNWQGNQQATAESINASQAALLRAIEELEAAARSGDQAALLNAVRNVTAALSRLLDDVKGASRLTDDPLIKQALMDATRAVAAALQALLQSVKNGDGNAFMASGAAIRSELTNLQQATSALSRKDSEEAITSNEYDKLNDFASNELMAAARSILEAAASIQRAKASRPKNLSADQLQGGDAIMDSALAITSVTGNLIKMAMVSQGERVQKGRASNNQQFYKKERTFAEGLISAAKAVAAATVDLVQVANKAAAGEVDEEAMVAASKGITAAAAQLVAASRVTADPFSENQKNLEAASKAVLAAVTALVEALRKAPETLKSQAPSVAQADEWLIKARQSEVQKSRAKQEIMAAMARADKEHKQLQAKLFELNKAEYKP